MVGDVMRGVELAAWIQRQRTARHRAGSQRHIGGDHQIPRLHRVLDVAVRLIKAGRHPQAADEGRRRHFEQAVDEATAKYQVAMIVYENSLRNCEQLFDEAVSADPSFAAAESRRMEIHREIAQLNRQRGMHEPINIAPASDVAPEVIPAPVRNASFHSLRFVK